MCADPAPVRRVRVRPSFRQEPDGTWTAWYSHYGFEVTGATREEALHRLRAENARRKETDPEHRAKLERLFREPPSDWLVEEIPRDEFEAKLREQGQAPPWEEAESPIDRLLRDDESPP